jgi:membrane protease YdiL (CAAX protease family)
MTQTGGTVVARPRTLPGIARVLSIIAAVTAWQYVWGRYAWERVPLAINHLETWATAVVVVGLGIVRGGRTSLRDLGWRFSNPVRLVAAGAFLTAVQAGLMVAIAGSSSGASGVRELGHYVASVPIGERASYAAFGVVIAFWEESLFRGDLLRCLRRAMKVPAAVIVSTAIFALYHRDLSAFGLFTRSLWGLLFALGATATRSLVPSAIAHALMWAIWCDA